MDGVGVRREVSNGYHFDNSFAAIWGMYCLALLVGRVKNISLQLC